MPAGMSRSRRTIIAFSVSLVMVMATVEATVVVAVLPTITRELGSFHLYRWIVAAYMLATAMLMPVFGRLADSHGRRPTFLPPCSCSWQVRLQVEPLPRCRFLLHSA